MSGVVAVARGRTGCDISNTGNLVSPVSSTHSRPLSHDITRSGLVLKLNETFLQRIIPNKYFLFNRFNTPSGIFVNSHVNAK